MDLDSSQPPLGNRASPRFSRIGSLAKLSPISQPIKSLALPPQALPAISPIAFPYYVTPPAESAWSATCSLQDLPVSSPILPSSPSSQRPRIAVPPVPLHHSHPPTNTPHHLPPPPPTTTMSTDPSLTTYISLLPHAIWATIKAFIFGCLLLFSLVLILVLAFGIICGLYFAICWAGPRVKNAPEWCREEYGKWNARRISRAVDREEQRSRERAEGEGVEMLGTHPERMSGETLRGGEMKGEDGKMEGGR